MKTKFDMLEELEELIGTEFDENVIYDIFDTDFEEFEKWNVDDWDVIIDEDRDEISDYTIYVNNIVVLQDFALLFIICMMKMELLKKL